MVQYTYSSHRTRRIEKIRKQRVKYPQVARNIVDTSDIILEVLDARFIEETRNKELEEEIEAQKKKIIYVLNKSDLVKASRLRKITKEFYPFAIVSCIKREGIKDLRDLIKRVAGEVETREKREILKDQVVTNEDAAQRIKVGVIGYPNAGKSSLLNILAGKAAAGVGADAGFTRNVQKIRLSEEILLIDSPGVIPEDQYSMTDKEKIAEHSLAGGKSYTQIKEPDLVVSQLFKKYPEVLQEFYKTKIESSDDLIEEVGKQKGLLKKGGVVNEDAAARQILKDWQFGKIKAGKKTEIKDMFKIEKIARDFAEQEQNEKHYAVAEIIDDIIIKKIKNKADPIHIVDLYAGAHPDRYEKLFKRLSENKQNKFDWVDSSEIMLNLAEEYLNAGNLMRRFRVLDFIEKDSIKYLEELDDEELDLILLKYSINYVEDLDNFFNLVSQKLKKDSSLISTLTMTSPILKSISTNARFLYKGKEFPENETRKLEEGESFTIKLFNESENPEAGCIKGAETIKIYHSKEKIEELAKKHNLKYFIGNWKDYLDKEGDEDDEDEEEINFEILILEKQ